MQSPQLFRCVEATCRFVRLAIRPAAYVVRAPAGIDSGNDGIQDSSTRQGDMTRYRRVAILGGGIAGMLCAAVFARHGIRPLCVDKPDPRRPQLSHVHFFDRLTWEGLERLLPGLGSCLRRAGVALGDESSYSFEDAAVRNLRPLPDIMELDQAIRRVTGPLLDRRGDLSGVRFHETSWRLQFGAVEEVETPLLIDASGLARASFIPVSAIAGRSLPVDSGPATSAYVTQLFRGVVLRDGQLGFRVRNSGGLGALLSRMGEGLCRLTLQLPPGEKMPGNTEGVVRLIQRLNDVRVATALDQALAVGAPIPSGARRAETVALDGIGCLPDGWLVVGDALVSTAPYLGWGLAQIVEQGLAIDDGLASGKPIPVVRNTLTELARHRWREATTRDALITLGV